MAIEIHLQPEKVWEFFKANKKRLKDEMVEIAENEDAKVEIYLTEHKGMPSIHVYRNEERVYEEGGVSKVDTEKTVQSIYAKWLPDQEEEVVRDWNPEDEADCLEFAEMIDEREDMIAAAFQDFMTVLLEDDMAAAEVFSNAEQAQSMIDHMVRYVASNCGYIVRRPMILVDDNSGMDIMTEYPYEEYDFKDNEIKH